ncbi:biliverdin-producing heme oxygenase, partial [Microbacterium sp. Leaf351]
MTTPIPFSTALRERSSGAHSGSESAGFMADLLKGEGTREDYVALVAQHWFIYEALEGAADRMRRDPVASVFISDKLTRLPALEADLAFLIGDDWTQRITPLPTTERYVARIRQVGATWAGGFVAHHYTRYLGDLSGGLFIGKLMARRFGFETNGIGFYIFGDIADPKAFKDVYREQLDAAPWDEAEKQRVIDE